MKIEDVWREYQSSLKAFLHKNVANHADVEDLLQEILIKTYQKLPTVQESSKIKSWLFQVANHTIIDFYRQNGKPEPNADALWYEQDEPKVVDQLAQCVEPFIKALPQQDADLLTAIEINGVSQKQYAEQHGIKYSTLKSRVAKSRNKLKHLFDDCCQMSIDSQGNLMDFDPNSPSSHQSTTPQSACKSC
ncbi:RNA polymerase sigma factor SigZ [Vibrio hippocampi]|uniref:RNA polymerase sigma factor SigZ n=1 Tax=Vibrio hippocampi TaxID=654686 RepID=UPI001F428784|nr:RNA polymerase sigma factor SigZ [Vibrio hippocampi]